MTDNHHRLNAKLKALFLVQFAGLILAVILSCLGRWYYNYPTTFELSRFHIGPYDLPKRLTTGWYSFAGPFAILWPATLFTIGIFLLTKPGWSFAKNLGIQIGHGFRALNVNVTYDQKNVKERWWHRLFNLERVTVLLGVVDILGAAFCIKATVGVEGSIFTPILLIVPTIIVLLEIFHWTRVAVWGSFCIFAFAASINPFPGFSHKDPSALDAHHVLLVISTGICICFPFLYLKTAKTKIECPKCFEPLVCLKCTKTIPCPQCSTPMTCSECEPPLSHARGLTAEPVK